MNTIYFESVRMVDFWENDPKIGKLRELARFYHESTEEYDRSVCSGVSEDGSAMPTTFEQRRLISVNATVKYRELAEKAAELGFDKYQWRREVSYEAGRQKRNRTQI